MDTVDELVNIKELVKNILEHDERARNEDLWLTYRVFRVFTNVYIPFSDFEKLPSPETIARCRRLIQNNDGLFPPTNPDVIAKRAKREKTIRENINSI